jgi:chromate reductase
MRVLGISGSLRAGSYNRKVLLEAEGLLPEGVELELYEGLKSVPPYDEDDDVQPAPEAVTRLRRKIEAADAILISTPEYNASIPGHLKNAIDWASRPAGAGALLGKSGALLGKPVAVVGASTGAFGAVWAQAELRKVLATAGARVVEGEVAIGHAHERFDESGQLLDDNLREQLAEVVGALLAEVRPPVPVAA